jgi:hypothetical protein
MKWLLFLLLISLPLRAADVSLAWDPSATPTVTGYKIYVGTASRVYQAPITIGNQTTYTVTGLAPGSTFYFAATAYDTNGNESDFSNEVFKSIPAVGAPTITIPAITQITVPAITTAYATIAWTTSIDCAGVVLYGTAEPLTKSVTANNLATTEHLAVIGPLTARTHYLFKVRSKCNDANIDSDLRSFNTK